MVRETLVAIRQNAREFDKHANALHEVFAELEEDNAALRAMLRALLTHFTPERINYVSGSDVGTKLAALLEEPQ